MAERPLADEDTRVGLPMSLPVAIGLLAAVLLLLFAIYWFILRTDYVAVFEGLPESDAAAVAAELTERKIDHRLADGGRTILVAAGEADQARLDIASSELPLRGQIGFELFNESDMGLTEFAQKINYQRALQGELARTIMLLDGIDNARVHLALPERALFRGNRNAPTAAVTLMLKPGRSITSNRVSGIQRLVAGAVPELSVGNVAILDETGRLVSAPEPIDTGDQPTGETQAVSQYYSARVSSAIASIAPNLDYKVQVLVKERTEVALAEDGAVTLADGATASAQTATQTPADNRRNYALEVEIVTSTALTPSLRDQLSSAAIAAAGLDQNNSDRLAFKVGPTDALATSASISSDTVAASGQAAPAASPDPWGQDWKWFIAVLFSALSGGAIMWLIARRSRSDLDEEAGIDSFADQLKARLAVTEDDLARA